MKKKVLLVAMFIIALACTSSAPSDPIWDYGTRTLYHEGMTYKLYFYRTNSSSTVNPVLINVTKDKAELEYYRTLTEFYKESTPQKFH